MSSKLKKYIRLIHLWLGLMSGLVVFIVAITGAIWSFETEISDLIYSHRKVQVQVKPFITISEVKKIASPYLNKINNINFLGKDRCIEVRQWERKNGIIENKYLYLNPYTGDILGKQLQGQSFFEVVLNLHMNLLLGEIGASIVKYATLIFLIIIISGLYLWWPKKRKGLKQRLTFDWKKTTKWKRKNFDLHSVLGFYALWITLFSVITALAWLFPWMDKAIYTTATLGETYKEYVEVYSISDSTFSGQANIDNFVFAQALNTYGKPFESVWFYLPQSEKETYSVYVNPHPSKWHTAEEFYFDQRTGQLLKQVNDKNMTNGEIIRDMYYDIHIGKILGLPGQLLMFFASMIVASLPITGFYIWYGRRRKKVNANSKHIAKASQADTQT